MSEIRLRQLAYSDLPAVLAIERRSFQTPWSLAMFVLELSKPSGICLAATTDDGLVGYLVCSRYADVWHLMNIAVNPAERRQGIARRLLERLFDEAGGEARYTLEVRTSNHGAIAMYERFGFRRAGPPPPLLPRQRRGRPDHVARKPVAGRGLIVLALETSCDDTCAAVTDGGRILSNVISSQAAAHARYGGVVPEVASRHHLELINPVVDAALGEAGVELDGRRRARRDPGPGLIGALLVGVATAKALAAPLASRWSAWTTFTATSPRTSSSRSRSSRRSSA